MRNRSHLRPRHHAGEPATVASRARGPRPRTPSARARAGAWATRLAAGAAAATAAACGRDKPAPPPPPAPPVAAAPPAAAPAPPAAAAPTSGWDADAGVALVVPGEAGAALLVAPGLADSAGVDTARAPAPALPMQVTLLAEHGVVGQTRATAPAVATGGGGCAAWPRVQLGPASGANVLPAWTVGLAAAPGATPPAALPLDSLDALAGPDSAALAAALTRLAGALPPPDGVSASTRAALRGVPFRVRRARGFAPDAGTRAVVAVLTRTVNQEAAPTADAVLLVAERPAAGGADTWRTAYSEHAAGREETLPGVDVLAAVRLAGAAAPRAALVVARHDDEGARYALLERAAPRRWEARWTSAQVACGR